MSDDYSHERFEGFVDGYMAAMREQDPERVVPDKWLRKAAHCSWERRDD